MTGRCFGESVSATAISGSEIVAIVTASASTGFSAGMSTIAAGVAAFADSFFDPSVFGA